MDLRCKNASGDCTNFILEDRDNTEKLTCDTVGTNGCVNRVLGNDNVQNMNCSFVGDQGCINDLINFQTFFPINSNAQNMN